LSQIWNVNAHARRFDGTGVDDAVRERRPTLTTDAILLQRTRKIDGFASKTSTFDGLASKMSTFDANVTKIDDVDAQQRASSAFPNMNISLPPILDSALNSCRNAR
jgi:hypothetical protein